jgi:hypothetical protein
VTSAVVPSEKWAVAVNCTVPPTAMLGLVGATTRFVKVTPPSEPPHPEAVAREHHRIAENKSEIQFSCFNVNLLNEIAFFSWPTL